MFVLLFENILPKSNALRKYSNHCPVYFEYGEYIFYSAHTFLENTGRNIILCARMLLLNQEYIDWTGELMMQSRENGEKPQLGQFFEDIEAIYLEIANFSEK